MESYLERSMKVLKRHGFMVQKVETFNQFGNVRQDLFGFIDILAIHPSYGTVGVQVCGPGDFAEHMDKLLGSRREALMLWLLAGNKAVLVGWRKLKASGWTARVVEFELGGEHLPELDVDIVGRIKAKDCLPLADIWGSP